MLVCLRLKSTAELITISIRTLVFFEKVDLEDFRKKHSSSSENCPSNPILTMSPTTLGYQNVLELTIMF